MLNNADTQPKKTKLAIFDVDGTLFDGTLGIELLNDLLKKGLFPKDIGQEIFSLYKKYKTDDGDKAKIVDEIYVLYGKGMEGNRLTEINQAAQVTWDRIKDPCQSQWLETRKQRFHIQDLSANILG